jgi:hypothetical protein
MGGVQASTTRVPLMIFCLLANDAWDLKDHELNTTHASHCKIQVCSTYAIFAKMTIQSNVNIVKCEVGVGNENVLFISLKKIDC